MVARKPTAHTATEPPRTGAEALKTLLGRTEAAPGHVDGAQTGTNANPPLWIGTLPVTPPSLNTYARMHWAVKKRTREAFQWEVWAAISGANGDRCPRGLDAVELRAVLTFPVVRGRDADNFGSTLWKFTQDVLTQQGVIPDDTADRCTGHPPKILVGDREQTLLMLWERERSTR